MFNSKLKLLIGIAVFVTFSLLISNVIVEGYSQAPPGNATRDAMGNFANFTNSSSSDIKSNLIKQYPTNTSK